MIAIDCHRLTLTRLPFPGLQPSARDDRHAPNFGGGLAFVVHADVRGPFAVGCTGGGLGFRASPDAAVECSDRVGRAVAVALHADHLDVIRMWIAFSCDGLLLIAIDCY